MSQLYSFTDAHHPSKFDWFLDSIYFLWFLGSVFTVLTAIVGLIIHYLR